jgi:hypothetical protein
VNHAWLGLAALFFSAACSIDDRTVSVAQVGSEMMPVRCQGIPVERELISDFSDAVEVVDVDGNHGIEYRDGPVGLGGVTQFFGAPDLSLPTLSLVSTDTGPALNVEAKPETPISDEIRTRYFGFGLGFGRTEPVCVDASAYRGVSFTLEGSIDTCELRFQTQISQDDRLLEGSNISSCTLGEACFPPFSEPLEVGSKRSFQFPFGALENGNPVPLVDPTTLINVAWKMYAPASGPACKLSMLIDDVAFYR